MDLLTILSAATDVVEHREEESSKTLFYAFGIALAGLAVVLSLLGLTQHGFPSDKRARNAVAGVVALVVAGTMAAAVITG